MKLNKRLLILTGLTFFLLAATAYAASADFLTQAQKYINQNCSKNKLTDEKALLCYLFEKSQEQDTSIASLNTTLSPIPSEINNLNNHQTQTDQQISSLQTVQASQGSQINSLQNSPSKSMKVLDANGKELGILLSTDYSASTNIYIPSLNVIATIGGSHLSRTRALLFQSANCTGTPYIQDQINWINDRFVYTFSPNKNFIVDPSVTPTQVSFQSELVWDDNTQSSQCISPQVNSNNSSPLIPITIPFSDPIATPLQFRYQ